jgi:hypothetical protein
MVEQWHTPDVWTRRAVDMALAPGIIDTIPRFVVDRKDGPVYLDIDDVPVDLSEREHRKVQLDGDMHIAWLQACEAWSMRGSWPYFRDYIRLIAGEDGHSYARHIRALAGAWGLGPIPEWHAAILPALIALDIETTNSVNAFGAGVFEMDRAELIAELSRCALITELVPGWCIASMHMIAAGLSDGDDVFDSRVRSNSVLAMIGWLQ